MLIAQNLKEYGANLPHINLQQPSIGIAQMYTSWRWENDPGGFSLTFRDGAFDGVLYQMKQIAGDSLSDRDGSVHIWHVDQAAHMDLVRLANGNVRLTCRRLRNDPPTITAAQVAP